MLCWGLLANVRPLVDLYEYLLKSSTDLARPAPPTRKSRILGALPFSISHTIAVQDMRVAV